MSKENSILQTFREQFTALSGQLNGLKGSKGHLLRQQALDKVEKEGLPSRRNEEYKYTPISSSLEKALQGFKPQESIEVKFDASILPAVEGNRIVFTNGYFNEELSDLKAEEGVEISLIRDQKAFLDEENNAVLAADAYANLNLALASNGCRIKVKKNAVIEAPLHIIHISDSSKGRVAATIRHEVIVEENARFTLCEFFMGQGEQASFTNSVVESSVASEAHFKHYKLGLDDSNDHRVDNTTCHQQANSTFTTLNLNFGGKIIRNNLNILLDGEHCETHLDGLYIPEEGGLVDNHTIVDHRTANSNSNELYKGIMPENTTGVFNGKVYVRPDAQKTNAFQSNKNILLSDTATINTKPQLEIWADDVKCSHGCTTGQLDAEQLFYLRARGIDEANARKLLLKAFAEEIVEKVSIKDVKELAEHWLDKRLGE